MPDVADQHAELDGQPVFWRTAPWQGTPTVYLHGVPTSSDDWLPFLQRAGGIAPDLPGFGRSGKRGDGDYTIEGYDRWLERFLDLAGVERFNLVVHDWGAVGLALAQRFPERVERLVVTCAVPLLPGYRWHRIARLWRTPVIGELVMGGTTRTTLKIATGASDEAARAVMAHLDQGTQRAILRLYRSSPPDKLARAGARLHLLQCPALALWGDRDPYIPARFADAYAAVLPRAEVVHLPDAGHWPWTERPDAIDTMLGFLAG